MVEAVENAHSEGGQAEKEKIGKDDAVEGDGLFPTVRRVRRRKVWMT